MMSGIAIMIPRIKIIPPIILVIPLANGSSTGFPMRIIPTIMMIIAPLRYTKKYTYLNHLYMVRTMFFPWVGVPQLDMAASIENKWAMDPKTYTITSHPRFQLQPRRDLLVPIARRSH